MLQLNSINITITKVISNKITLLEQAPEQGPQQYPVAEMEVEPGPRLGLTCKRLGKDIVSLLSDIKNISPEELGNKIESVVEKILPDNFAQNPIIRTLNLPGETIFGGEQHGNFAVITVSATYKQVKLGLTDGNV